MPGPVVLAGAVLVGLGYRVAYVLDETGKLFGDNVVVGLMAKHILEGHHYVFYWGQGYLGSLEAYTVAALGALFGLGDRVLMAGPLLYGVAYALSFLPLGRLVYGEAEGRVALVLAFLCPPLLALWSSSPRGAYPEVLFLGNVVLILTLYLARGLGEKERRGRVLLLGLVAGLGFWTHPLVVVYLVPAALFLFIVDPGIVLRRDPWLGLAAFTVGSAPYWLATLPEGLAGLRTFASAGEGSNVRAALHALVVEHGPKILGVREILGHERVPFGVLGWAVGALLAGAVLLQTLLALRRPRRAGGFLLVLVLVATLVAELQTRFGTWHTQRYLLPLYSVLFPFLAASWVMLRRRSRTGALVVAGLVFAVIGVNAWWLHRSLDYDPRRKGWLPEVASFLEENGVRHGYADYSEALVTTWMTRERVILADWKQGRYPTEEIADWKPRALLVRGDGEHLARVLRSLDCEFQLRRFDSHALAWDIRPPVEGQPLARRGWTIEATHQTEDARFVVDGDLETRWGSAVPQTPGMALEIDLGERRLVRGVHLDSGGFFTDIARGIRVEKPDGAGGWRALGGIDSPLPGLLVEDGAVHWRRRSVVEVRFEPVETRRLRIVQTGSDPKWDWSVAELEIMG